MSESRNFASVDYEVYGKVQDVFFRQYTYDKAIDVGAVGTVMNTPSGTVKGTFQGTQSQVEEMKYFVSKVGSPESKIEKAKFSNERQIEELDYTEFTVLGDDW